MFCPGSQQLTAALACCVVLLPLSPIRTFGQVRQLSGSQDMRKAFSGVLQT
jgi:hypothetical protein